MSLVQKIQCPSCGSNSTYKLFDGNYKCNYCQSNFNVKEQQQKVRESTIKQPEVILPKYNPKVMWFFSFGIFVVMGISTGIFYFRTSNKLSSITAPFESKQPVIEMTYAFAGSNGAALWLISKVNGSSDSISYKLHIVDPKIKKIISTVVILPAFKNSDDLNFTSKIGSRFLQYDDLAYNISKDNGLVAYNIYSGKKEITTQTLVKNFPELNSGIIKVEEFPGEKGFKITSAQGEVFRLDPYTKQLIAKETKNRIKMNKK